MDILPNLGEYQAIDPQNMHDLITSFPEQLKQGIDIVESGSLSADFADGVTNIVLLGMGGSAIGGDLVRAIFEKELALPFFVNRTYEIPGFIDENTLVIASSYSGNTEETLTALNACVEKNTKIITISTNGKLAEIASEYGFPFFDLPKGYPPRAALGFSLSSVMMIMYKLNFIPDPRQSLMDAYNVLKEGLEKCNYRIEAKMNPAKIIAKRLYKKLPIIYTASKYWNSVGVRIRGQIEENAKMLAYSNEFPEMNHNEIVGLERIKHLRELIVPIFIMDKRLHPRVRFRMEFTKDIFHDLEIEPIILEGIGENIISRILSIIQLGDFISYYLAILNRVDPTPVEIIETLKKQLQTFNE